MSGILELNKLLQSMRPKVMLGDFVFCTVAGDLANYLHLNPIATFIELEGLTLVLEKEAAEQAKLSFDSVFKQITLTVHSSLDAVGLTAAIAEKLSSKGISANVIAAYYHDHIFVPKDKVKDAIDALNELSEQQ